MRTAVLLAVLALSAAAQSPEAELFEKQVRPLFASKCSPCHGEKMQMGGLKLSSTTGIRAAVASGMHKRLPEVLTWSDKVKMPPSGKLEPSEIAAVRAWVEAGAPLPAENVKPVTEKELDRSHWSFQPVRAPAPPPVKQTSWVRNPIDRFILAKLEEKKIKPASPAEKLTLLRRATYDLTGLPPTPDEIRKFLADTSPGAFAKVVDRLLASPAYGEHWGRHWLDVARYADSTGMDEDNPYPHAWRYRDYVVQAFNKDLPYDQFIKEQLAGDLLPSHQIVATGFLAIGPRPLAQQDRLQMVYDVVDEQIDTVSKTFMGLTVACARCHDHKFDPIPTKDYYGLASIFASTTSFRNQGRPGSISYMFYLPLDPTAYDHYQAHRWRMLAKQVEMEDALSEDLGREQSAIRVKVADLLSAAWQIQTRGMKEDAAASKYNVDEKTLRTWLEWLRKADEKARGTYLKKWLEATDTTIEAVAKQYQESVMASGTKCDTQLERWRTRLSKDMLQDRDIQPRPTFDADADPFFAAIAFKGGPMDVPESDRVQFLRSEWEMLKTSLPEAPALASAVADGAIVDQKVFVRGSLHNPGEPVAKHFPIVLAGTEQKPIAKGSGRLELAEWLTKPDHPLTARVMVNRIWQWHFGEGLVRTPNNWGKTGERPTHPELLDYLATEFVRNGWSIKAMHRMILLSSTWQMSSRASKQVRDADPGNRLWSRANRVRMSVEEVRDSLLTLDGSLDSTLGGNLNPTDKGKRARIDMDEIRRRTMYVPVRRGSIPALLSTFDFGDATTSSEGRPRTNVAPQALFLMNSKFVVDRSTGLAKRLLASESPNEADLVSRAYLTVLGRRPDGSETDAALTYVSTLRKRLGDTGEARLKTWSSLCHVLVSSNEFLYLE